MADTSSHGHFVADISSRTFRRMDISSHGHFVAGTFRRMDFSPLSALVHKWGNIPSSILRS